MQVAKFTGFFKLFLQSAKKSTVYEILGFLNLQILLF